MIEVKNVTKVYGNHIAVRDLSFSVANGEILGFLGPNGAGKTTTMNMITGYISATGGDIIINNFNIVDMPEKAKKNIGYLPDTPPVYPDMTVSEYLDFVGEIKGVKQSERKDMIAHIKDMVKISEMSNRLIRNLSKGYRQRVGLAQALMGYPSVIILDEPTVGLDPKQIIEMREVINSLRGKHTVILSSHIMQEVSAVCDRVMIINKGEIVASDTIENLSSNLTKNNKIITRIKGTEREIESVLEQIDLIRSIDFEGSKEEGSFDYILIGEEQVDIRETVFNAFARNRLPILMMKSRDFTLEEIYLQITAQEGTNEQ